MYSEKTLRRKSRNAGFRLHKGFRHCFTMKGCPVYRYPDGTSEVGYILIDEVNNNLVWGCYDSHIDHLWQLDDVEDYLREFYQAHDLKF